MKNINKIYESNKKKIKIKYINQIKKNINIIRFKNKKNFNIS